MYFINEKREKIKADNPGIKITEIAKKGGEMWNELKDKKEWEEKAAKDKERYLREMKEYESSGKAASFSEKTKAEKRKNEALKSTPTKSGSGGNYKSKEYISDDDSSSDGGDKAKKKPKVCERTLRCLNFYLIWQILISEI